MQVRIDFNIDEKLLEKNISKIYEILEKIDAENILISNEEENPELFF